MSQRESDVNPYLQGNFAPWRMEGEALDLDVEGELPAVLRGTFYRNGPNPAYEPTGPYHWFSGDGMIHAITLQDGRASYRNRYVKSRGLVEERAAGRSLSGSMFRPNPERRPKNTANTNIVAHAGRLFALVESALPTELTPGSLETLGEYDFAGRLRGPMTAHPKIDPDTGDLVFFGNSIADAAAFTYHVADHAGALVHSTPITLPWASMVHDFAITRAHAVFLLGSLVFRPECLAEGKNPFCWEPERGMRIGVLPRRGEGAAVRWFEIEGGYVFHPMNAYDDGDAIVLDVARYGRMDLMTPAAMRDRVWDGDGAARLHRYHIDLQGGAVRSQPLDDVPIEFPRVDERRVGRKHRFGYAAAVGPEGSPHLSLWTAVRRYDLERGTFESRAFGEGNGAGEPLFVPKNPESEEGDGYLLVLVYDRTRNASDLWVLDAQDIQGEPVARVRLPHRVPYGFHANWVPAA